MLKEKFSNIVSHSPKMMSVFNLINKVSTTTTNVLILGESGTGKELVAQAIHKNSTRSDNPFIAINCACIPNELLESELFGYEKGAFTGAIKRTAGKFEAANGGTIFLDEIASLPLHLQAKLLRVLQEREVTRLGSSSAIKIDVRVIAACNEHLDRMVREKTFRSDLYYRLSVIPIELPPLRERDNDISHLINYFLKRFNDKYHKSVRGFTLSALECIKSYSWPGNIRELEHFVERIVVLGGEEQMISCEDLPRKIVQPPCSQTDISYLDEFVGLNEAKRQFESEFIIKRLEMYNWNQMKTARNLKIHRNTLIQKIKALKITKPTRDDLFAVSHY